MPTRLSDNREAKMPDSPASNSTPLSMPSASVASIASSPVNTHPPNSGPVVHDGRPVTSINPTIVNGHPSSPGRSLSPSLANGSQLPPTCGARQLSKLKRFLTTLQQFGSDISPEIGERVRSLIVSLVNNAMTVEEFHQQLQDATNFPLRPFVIPFLKANLPLLQQELIQCSQMAKQSPHQYMNQHEPLLHDRERLHLDPEEFVGERVGDKRKVEHERPKENGIPDIGLSPNKRSCPAPSDMDGSVFAERLLESIKQDSDDWRNVETMLQCVMSIIEKAKRAVSVLQERCIRDREEMATWARRMTDEAEAEVKRRAADLMAKTLKQTEDRVAEVRRRAEEAVSDVKRQAVIELQKAVCAAEEKANDALAQAHQRMDKAVSEARRQATDETLSMVNKQDNSRENCWNCGRKANETCSGCNVARYCGAFCQHKDWENHQRDCGKQGSSSERKSPKSGERASPDKRSSPTGRGSTTPVSPANSGNTDPITSLSDYVRKTPTS
ncbi:protein CBFA2T2-like isoform X2 [Rhopilema esculentum]|uniref:protein CBFA2T2-like isoform X2 n=1 Tax=Rhopilema esculentum TaxID=499914 RepID=UPI0031D6785C